VQQGCVTLWQRLADVPRQLTARVEGDQCIFSINEKPWQVYDAETGQIRPKNVGSDL